jgi:hypothetical protein
MIGRGLSLQGQITNADNTAKEKKTVHDQGYLTKRWSFKITVLDSEMPPELDNPPVSADDLLKAVLYCLKLPGYASTPDHLAAPFAVGSVLQATVRARSRKRSCSQGLR